MSSKSIITSFAPISLSTNQIQWRHLADCELPELNFFLNSRNLLNEKIFAHPATYRGRFNIHSQLASRWIFRISTTNTNAGWAELHHSKTQFSSGHLLFNFENCTLSSDEKRDALSLLVSAIFIIGPFDIIYLGPFSESNELSFSVTTALPTKMFYSPIALDAILIKRDLNEIYKKHLFLELTPNIWWKTDNAVKDQQTLHYLLVRYKKTPIAGVEKIPNKLK